MSDKPTVHIDSATVREDILDYQVENCPTCKSELYQGFGLAGGGLGVYGMCQTCAKIVWKCEVEE